LTVVKKYDSMKDALLWCYMPITYIIAYKFQIEKKFFIHDKELFGSLVHETNELVFWFLQGSSEIGRLTRLYKDYTY